MRSGSTLVQHILAADSNLIAAGETKIVYKSVTDLRDLIFAVYSYNNHLGFFKKTIIEKCCHNELIENVDLILHPRIKLIFLIREPLATISSLLNAKGFSYSDSISAASNYYMRRLENLQWIAGSLKAKSNAFFLTYDQLIDDKEKVLSSLSVFLGTQEPLGATYKIQNWTGVLGKGDYTENIQSGFIKRNKKKYDIALGEELEHKLKEKYKVTKRILEKLCSTSSDF